MDLSPGASSSGKPPSSSSSSSSLLARFPQVSAVVDENTLRAINSFKQEKLAHLRPWNEFVDGARMSRPNGVNGATARVNHNLSYFSTNYFIVTAILLIYVLVTNLFLMISSLLILAMFNVIRKLPSNEPVSILGGKFIATQSQYYLMLAIFSIPLLWWSSAGSTIFYLVSVSAFVVIGHAAIMEPPIQHAFEEEP